MLIGEKGLSRYPVITLKITFKDETRDLVLKKRSIKTLLGTCGGIFRCQARICTIKETGVRLVSDDDLRILEEGTHLVVE